jgi:glyoxylase-like metal-dependent hydrolase (beta-lactamase superfamily II)
MPMMLATGVSYLDLHFLGRRHVIATAVIAGAGEVALVDPGPASCLDRLEQELQAQGIALADVTHLFLTHIHLDHAGATGTIVARHPRVKVLVHERGEPHLVDPSKLLDSATRLYGREMDRLWGQVLPVPASNVTVLRGGERVNVAGREFDVAYTPGHASHHVSYFNASSGVAFVGDTAGVAIEGGYVLAPTPPPDIDIELWTESARRIQAWQPQLLFLTHFGPAAFPPATQLQTLIENLQTAGRLVLETLQEQGSDDERRQRFADRIARELRRSMTEEQVASYASAAPFDLLWLGLARYWRKRGA